MMGIRRHQLYALMLGLGAANALIRPVIVAVRDEGLAVALNGFGISFVIWLSLGWALWTLTRSSSAPATDRDYAVASVVAILLLVPIATVSWLATGLVALYWMRRGAATVIAASACAVIAFAALRDPIASLVLKLLATPLLDFDAALVAEVLAWGIPDIDRAGNLIYTADGHQLMILTGCTSYTNMSIALLGWFAISKARAGETCTINWTSGLLVALAIFAINIGRLAVMGLGPEAYVFMHDSHGALLSELLMVAATVVISIRGPQHGTPAQLLPRCA